MVDKKPIQMVDLVAQYENIKSEVDQAISNVVSSAQFINGVAVTLFKQELAAYLGVKHVIPCANGTDALQIALMALGLKPGDEVITPSFTYIATTEVIALLGLTPVFVDVDPHTFCMDVAALEKVISSKTKVIVPVHLYGQAANMEEIVRIAEKYDLKIVEDNAQAIGSDYTFSDGRTVKTGTIGDIGCTSFFPSKNLGCYGDGGAIFTNQDDLADKLRMIANHGQSKKYVHDVVGCNSRLDTIQAAVLRVKLPRLNDYIAARRNVAAAYDKAFENISEIDTPFRDASSRHVFHQYTLKLNRLNRDKLQAYLADKGIPSMIYYPIPAHKQKMFRAFGLENLELPVTDDLINRVISLPIHTEMEEEQLAYIIQQVLEFVRLNSNN